MESINCGKRCGVSREVFFENMDVSRRKYEAEYSGTERDRSCLPQSMLDEALFWAVSQRPWLNHFNDLCNVETLLPVALLKQGQLEEAVVEFKAGLGGPDGAAAVTGLVVTYVEKGEFGLALALDGPISDGEILDRHPLEDVYRLYARMADFGVGERSYLYHGLNPEKHSEGGYLWGCVFTATFDFERYSGHSLESGSESEPIQAIDKAIASGSNPPHGQLFRGVLHLARGNCFAALADLVVAATQAPDCALAHACLAIAYGELGLEAEHDREFSLAKSLSPEMADAVLHWSDTRFETSVAIASTPSGNAA